MPRRLILLLALGDRVCELPAPMTANRLWISILSLLCFTVRLSALAAEFQGLPLPENTSVVLAADGEGVQIYESRTSSAGGYQWVLKAPEAELKSLTGEILGKHFGGPAWSLNDGSELLGSLPPLKAISAANRQNIPWLLIAAKSRNGLGILGSAEYVLRIATVGGIPPAEPPKSATDTARVKYRAIYLFLRQATP
jgi:Protein of unknown function (DUF3455)